jgi:hypothetical protein
MRVRAEVEQFSTNDEYATVSERKFQNALSKYNVGYDDIAANWLPRVVNILSTTT